MRLLPSCVFFALLGVVGLGPARATPVAFDLPAQPAGAALVAFAKQADVEILFASGELKATTAAEVRGVYEPEQALARLLEGTGFTARRESTGKFVVRAVAAAVGHTGPPRADTAASAARAVTANVSAASEREEPPASARIVELPPLTVSAAMDEQPWNYLEIPGYEILSRCKIASVVRWAHEVERLRQWLGVILPEDLRFRTDVPTGVILYDIDNKPVVSREVVADMVRSGGSADGRQVTYRSLPNMRLADKDGMSFFFILNPAVFGAVDPDIAGTGDTVILTRDATNGLKLTLKPEHIHYLARNRTPALPGWFVDGVVDLFETADFNRESVVVLDPLVWLTPEETKEIKKNPDVRRKLLALPELFSAPRANASASDEALRRAEIVLFLRWGLAGRNQPRKEALWKFIRLASAAPVNEAVFQDCFGFGYEEAERRLGDYLSEAVAQPLRLVPAETIQLPPLSPSRATALEIARLKGDWDRLEIAYVKSHYPELTSRYVEQARRTLHRAYDKGERDPRLLAVMGLCECDAGDDAAARPYLEAAIQGGVVRPRANYELARLRYAEARKKLGRPEERLTAAQAADVLQPLVNVFRQNPPLLESYALTAEVWTRSDVTLGRRELDLLGDGVNVFPWNAPLVYQVAWLNAQHGFKPEAEALIQRGLAVTANPALITRFEQLRAALVKGGD